MSNHCRFNTFYLGITIQLLETSGEGWWYWWWHPAEQWMDTRWSLAAEMHSRAPKMSMASSWLNCGLHPQDWLALGEFHCNCWHLVSRVCISLTTWDALRQRERDQRWLKWQIPGKLDSQPWSLIGEDWDLLGIQATGSWLLSTTKPID